MSGGMIKKHYIGSVVSAVAILLMGAVVGFGLVAFVKGVEIFFVEVVK